MYEGYEFLYKHDFRIYSERRENALKLRNILIQLGFEPAAVDAALYWYVAGFIPNSFLVKLCRLTDYYVTEFGVFSFDDINASKISVVPIADDFEFNESGRFFDLSLFLQKMGDKFDTSAVN